MDTFNEEMMVYNKSDHSELIYFINCKNVLNKNLETVNKKSKSFNKLFSCFGFTKAIIKTNKNIPFFDDL